MGASAVTEEPTGMDEINSDASTETLPCTLKPAAKGRQIRVPSFRIRINDRLSEPEQFVTVAHELGHIFCGHLGGSESLARQDTGWPDRRDLALPMREIEAEACAYLVAARAGVQAKSIEYLRGYARKANISVVDLDLIVRAAARIERLCGLRYGSLTFG